MFLRATLNRILALPDLAGLSGRRRPIGVTKRSAMQDKNGSPRAKRQVLHLLNVSIPLTLYRKHTVATIKTLEAPKIVESH